MHQDDYVQAYEAWPDPRTGFRYVIEYVGFYDDSADDVRRLIEVHRAEVPNDAWIDYCRGVMLLRQERFAQAHELLAVAMKKATDDYERGEMLRFRIIAMHEAGEALEAYDKLPDADGTFKALAELSFEDDNPEQLKKLVDAHRLHNPDDSWLDYYEATVLMQRQDLAGAVRLLLSGREAAEVGYLRSEYDERLVDVFVQADDVVEFCRSTNPDPDLLAALGRRLFAQNDWASLEQIIKTFRLDEPADWVKWEAQMHWSREDYAALIEQAPTLAKWRRDASSCSDVVKRYPLRARLRTGQLKDARRWAAQAYDTDADVLQMILVEAAERNVAEVAKLVKEFLAADGRATELYFDADFKDILRSAEFRPVRLVVPPPLFRFGYPQIVMLSAQTEFFQAGSLQGRLESLSEDTIVESLPKNALVGSRETFSVRQGASRVLVTHGQGPFYETLDERRGTNISAELRMALKQRQSWAAICVPGEFAGGQTSDLAQRVAVAMLDDGSLVYHATERYLMRVSDALKAALAADVDDIDFESHGEFTYLFPDFESWRLYHQDDENNPAEHAQQRLPRFVEAFKTRGPQQSFEIQVQHRVGPVAESAWLRVERVTTQMNEYGRIQRFVGTFQKDSVLNPYFKRGEPVAINEQDVLDWKYTAGDKTISAADVESSPNSVEQE